MEFVFVYGYHYGTGRFFMHQGDTLRVMSRVDQGTLYADITIELMNLA